jgi:hypothetical protein
MGAAEPGDHHMHKVLSCRLGCLRDEEEFHDVAVLGKGLPLIKAFLGDDPPGLCERLLAGSCELRQALARHAQAIQRADCVRWDLLRLPAKGVPMPSRLIRPAHYSPYFVPVVLWLLAGFDLIEAVREAVREEERHEKA